jgi:dipeptidyl-peptidase 4
MITLRTVGFFGVGLMIMGGLVVRTSEAAMTDDLLAGGRRGIDAATVAKLPAPGTIAPGSFAFTPDGKAVTYLKAESASLSRVLWKADIAGGPPKVIARPPGSGDTDANVSKEEALRRERQRLRETGITQVVRAKKADVAIIPLGGDLYVLRGWDGPLERLTQTESPEIDPQLNADGTSVVFVRDNHLFSIDLKFDGAKHPFGPPAKLLTGSRDEPPKNEDGVSRGLAEFMAQEEMGRFTGFWLSPVGPWVVYQETDERHIPRFEIVHQGGEYSVETHRYPFPGAANAKVKLGWTESEDWQKTKWFDFPSLIDDAYLARVEWYGISNCLVQILSRDQRTLKLFRADMMKPDQPQLLIEDVADTWINLHNDLRVIDTGEILWSSERTGFRHLELYDKDGKKIRDLTSGAWAVDAVEQVDSKRREVWFSGWMENPLEKHLYRVSLDGGPITKVTYEAGTHKAIVAPDGETYVDTFTSRTRPPVTRIVARDGRVITTIDDASLSDPRVDQLKLTPPEIVSFEGRDGTKFSGAYYAPRSKALGPKPPLIVLLYGGPHVQYVSENWTLTADMNAQHLAERGFAVWKMDNRGSARRGHAFESAIRRNMGSVEVRDQVDGVGFVAKRWPEVDTSRVGVSGSSYGGYMTLRCLTEAPDVFKAGVSIAPVTDWDGYDTCYTERYMGTPINNPQGYHDSSVLHAVDRLKGDLLIIHGMIDENVHFRHSARLVTALIAANKTFRMLPLPEERHSSRKEAARKYVAEQLTEFFENSLKSR